jgi:hypothetical protein
MRVYSIPGAAPFSIFASVRRRHSVVLFLLSTTPSAYIIYN